MMNIRSLDVSQNNVGLHGVKSDCCGQRILLHKVSTPKTMKKYSEATQTLRAGCSKADPQTNKQTHKQTGAITIHCAT